MREVRLTALTLSAFRSFRDKATIQFPRSGTVLLRGTNRDTGGSSAAGKSSINLAIQYALGSSPFPSTQLQSWHTEEPLQVELQLDTPSGPLTVSRSPKSFKLTIDGEKVGGAAKALEGRLADMLGLDPDMLAALTYRGQRTRGSFLSKANAEAQEFLTQLLGLHRFEAAVEASKEQQKLLAVQLEAKRMSLAAESQVLAEAELTLHPPELILTDALASQAQDLEAEVVTLRDQAEKLKQVETEEKSVQHQAVRTAKAAFEPLLEAATSALRAHQQAASQPVTLDDTERTRLTELLTAVLERSKAAKKEDAVRAQEQNEAWANVRTEVTELQAELDNRENLEKQLFELQYQLAILETEKCPTCEQKWSQSSGRLPVFRANIEKLEAELLRLDAVPEKLAEAQARAKALTAFVPSPLVEKFSAAFQQVSNDLAKEEQRLAGETALRRAETQRKVSEAQAEVARIKAQESQAEKQALELASHALAAVYQRSRELQSQQMAKQASLSSTLAALASAQAENKRRQSTYEVQLEAFTVRKARHEASAQDVQIIQAAAAAEQDFVAMVGPGGFLGAIFDEVLAEISDEANNILASVPNTAQVSISFRSESLTQKGTIKKGITTVVTIAGHEAPLASGCSGGMIAAIEFAVDLAVDAVVCRRLGVSPSWVILDEPFEGLGPVEKEGCLEILSRYAEDKLVLVVDHSSETKEFFTQTIDIEYSHGVSAIS